MSSEENKCKEEPSKGIKIFKILKWLMLIRMLWKLSNLLRKRLITLIIMYHHGKNSQLRKMAYILKMLRISLHQKDNIVKYNNWTK